MATTGAPRVVLVAHRGGNHLDLVADAAVAADMVEIDVHWHRRRLEVRHAKRLWGTPRLWERWYLLPRDTPRPTLADLLAAVGPDVPLLVDMKGWSPRLARAVYAAIAGRAHTTVATKSWWLLRTFAADPTVRTLSSAGTRLRLALLRRRPLPRSATGVVVHERLLTEAVVGELAARGDVFTWAVDDRRRALELANWGVTGIIADDLGLIAELRAAGVHEPPHAL